jgi:hypothetical protein
MSDYPVDRLPIEKIERLAREVLAWCPKLENGAIDILRTLRMSKVKTVHGDKVLRLVLVDDDQLPDDVAHMWASKDRVTITARASLWEKAQQQDPEVLKDLRHEFGHALLHSSGRTASRVPLARKLNGNSDYKSIDTECSAEKQADAMAACLAMPLNKIRPSADVRDVVADWNVLLTEAQWRLERVRLTTPKRIPESIRRDIDRLGVQNGMPAAAQALWDQLPEVSDMSPQVARIADGFLVEYCEYKKCTQTGWIVMSGKVVPLMPRMCDL